MGLIDQFLANPPDPSIRRGLQSGKAGAPVRLGLSFASATGLLVVFLGFIGTLEALSVNIGPQHIVPALATIGVTLCFVLGAIWWTYRPWRRFIQTVIIMIGIWVVTIPTAVVIGQSGLGDGFYVAATIFAGVTASAAVITFTAFHAYVGRPVVDRQGGVTVECPACGYSLVGLEACTCPECGKTFTIDELILGQDYAVLKDVPASSNPVHPPITAVAVVERSSTTDCASGVS